MSVNDVVNVELLRHPYNWIVVVLILALAVMALTLLSQPLTTIGGLTKVV